MSIPSEYRSIRSLGLGATSEVFEAVKVDTGETIALKVFSPLILSDAEAVERLKGEVEALEKVHHANIVALKNICARPDFFALELELVRGTDLRLWSTGYDSALHEPKLWILAQVARGLGAAHENGVLHRDLKPENVLVSTAGDVKLTDFGLSRSISRLTLTRMGLLVGSLGYMAPECVNGLRASEQSDLFSFGVIAYELLAGRAPFEAETPQALIKRITDGSFEPLRSVVPSIPSGVAEMIDRCLAVNPSLRPESSWSIEAVLMNALLASGLVSHCRLLVGVASREAALTTALSAKHAKLSGRVQDIMDQSGPDRAETRRQLLPAVNELKRVFPDDPMISRALEMMTSGSAKRVANPWLRRSVVAAVLMLAILLFGWSIQKPFTRHAAPTLTAATLAPDAVSIPEPIPAPMRAAARKSSESQTEPQPESQATTDAGESRHARKENRGLETDAIKKRVLSKQTADGPSEKVAVGTLVFQADPDVDVYVDGKLVSPTAWESYEAPVGERKIRLVKAGFDPIDNIVSVKAEQKTVVRAKQ